MKLILKYTKPYVWGILLCVALLLAQAVCDLSMPNMMSNIVNVGIQQSGIEAEAPEAISGDGMDFLNYFMDDNDRNLIESGYIQVLPQSSEALRYEKTYPMANTIPLYIRTANTELELEGLKRAYGKAAYGAMEYLSDMRDRQIQGGGQYDSQYGTQDGDQYDSQYGAQDGDQYDSQYDTQDGAQNNLQDETRYDAQGNVITGSSPTSVQNNGQGLGNDSSQGGAAGEILDEGSDSNEELPVMQLDADFLYSLLPELELTPDLSSYIQSANSAEESMRDQVGVAFNKLFYQEIGIDISAMQSDYIWSVGMNMLALALLIVLISVMLGFFSSRIAAKISRSLRLDLFSKVQHFSNTEMDKFSTASLITRTTNDVQQVQMLITMGIRMMFYAPIMGIGGIIFALDKSVSLSWIIVLTVIVLIGLMLIVLGVALPRFKILQKLVDKLNLVSRESLSGMMVIRAFGNEEYDEKRFDSANKELSDTNLVIQKVMSLVMPGMSFVMNMSSLLIVWFGTNAIANANMQIGDMMAFIQYAMQVIVSFLMIAMMFVIVPRALVSANRIAEVLDTDVAIKDSDKPEKLETVKGEITFKNVYFKYPNAEENVLEDVSFTARPGETTAFIGSTGSGKSTLINLIPRFYDPTQGSIYLDGVDIKDIKQLDLRDNIGYVPQKGLLFSGTVASNLKYGKPDATEEDMHQAIEVAQAEEFIYGEGAKALIQKGSEGSETITEGDEAEGQAESSLWEEEPTGTDLPVSQGGTNVSGGQRQRLSIARAIIKKTPIYIFDDSFSALDFKTDAALRRALKKNTSNTTMLIVAQRVSTIMNAEQIVVLKNGRVVGTGTHKELLISCEEYREIAESQLQKEELA